jgi:hypothetical protein
VKQSRGKSNAREKRTQSDPTPDASDGSDVAAGGEIERYRDGSGTGDDEPTRERLLVAGSTEEGKKADPPEDRKDDE